MVAVEGLDGAGKATLVDALGRSARARGASVATLAFPRYDVDVHAALAGEALRGEHGDTAASVHAMALLFALDRRAAAPVLAEDLRAAHDLVLVDRYVASNAAYGSARLHEGVGGFAAWVHATEVERFGVPAPDAQVLVRVPPELAAQRVRERARGRRTATRTASRRTRNCSVGVPRSTTSLPNGTGGAAGGWPRIGIRGTKRSPGRLTRSSKPCSARLSLPDRR